MNLKPKTKRKTNNAGHDDDEDDEDDEEMEEEFHDLDDDDDDDGEGSDEASGNNKSKNQLTQSAKKGENEKLRRRLPMSVKELIDYHSSNGKSIKEIVNKINVVCRTDEKVSYGVCVFVLDHPL